MEPRSQPWAVGLSLLALLLWSYWTTLVEMADAWSDDPQYSHGYLVPLFAIYLLCAAAGRAEGWAGFPHAGVVILLAGLGMRGGRVFLLWLFSMGSRC